AVIVGDVGDFGHAAVAFTRGLGPAGKPRIKTGSEVIRSRSSGSLPATQGVACKGYALAFPCQPASNCFIRLNA
ncbi:MAG TPA: hypothetical protein PLQ52_02025, partial [Lacunisphaera sp.]|nr:hypothetical protein [Lacunisphaera sp.]